jgi:hypothetical protein
LAEGTVASGDQRNGALVFSVSDDQSDGVGEMLSIV